MVILLQLFFSMLFKMDAEAVWHASDEEDLHDLG